MENTIKINLTRLNFLRGEKGYTITNLAEKAGLPRSTVSKITSGGTLYPSPKTINALAKALDVPPEELGTTPFLEELSAKQKEVLTQLFLDNPEGEYILFVLSKYDAEHFNKLIPLITFLSDKTDEDIEKSLQIIKLALT